MKTARRKPRATARRLPSTTKSQAVARPVKVSPALTQAIQRVVSRNIETKYRAEYIAQNVGVVAGATIPADLKRIMPSIAQGTGDNERIGDKIEPVKAKCDITIHFQATPSGGTAGAYSDCEVHLLVLAVKGAKTAAQVATTAANTLLRDGNGGNTDPTLGAFTQVQFLENVNHFPVNTDQFTLLKRMTHRFAKGDYDINGPAAGSGGTQKCFASPKRTFTYQWKPPTLEYNSAVDTFPTNHYPVYVMWVTALDGGPYSGNIYYGARTELWYKDA